MFPLQLTAVSRLLVVVLNKSTHRLESCGCLLWRTAARHAGIRLWPTEPLTFYRRAMPQTCRNPQRITTRCPSHSRCSAAETCSTAEAAFSGPFQWRTVWGCFRRVPSCPVALPATQISPWWLVTRSWAVSMSGSSWERGVEIILLHRRKNSTMDVIRN